MLNAVGLYSPNALQNMEMMLGYGYNSGIPCYANGYCVDNYSSYLGGMNYYNMYNGMYNGIYPSAANYYAQSGNPTFTGAYNPNYTKQTTTQSSAQTQGQSTNFGGMSDADVESLKKYYAKNNCLDEGFKGAATGGISWMLFENVQTLLHPKNGFSGFKGAEEIFKNASKDFMKQNQTLTQEAYDITQKFLRDGESKWFTSGWLRKSLLHRDKAGNIINDANKQTFDRLKQEMADALRSGNKDRVAEVAAKMEASRGMDGKLMFIDRLRGKNRTMAERLTQKAEEITKNANLLTGAAEGGIGSLVQRQFKKDFKGFMFFETVANVGKIWTAFTEGGVGAGFTQLFQSAGKSAIGTAGWCLGRAAGTWAGTKLGAAIGTAICPGVGTVVGSLLGFTIGSIGMWAGHKLGNAILGEDVSNKIETDKLAKTQEGQAQLAQFALSKAQNNEQLDANTIQALQRVLVNTGAA